MAGPSDPMAGLKDFIDQFFAEAHGSSQETFRRYIELERTMLEQYQKYIADQLATHDDVVQNFTKLMMSSCLQIVSFQRENRTRFLQLQSTIAEAHLKFLERIGENLAPTPTTPTPTPAPTPTDGDRPDTPDGD